MTDPGLWKRLCHFEFDAPESASPFSLRLQEKLGWSPSRTQAAIEEYRKFLYLAGVSEGGVVPSKAVDEVWHFHLTYTRSYWEELCGRVLGRPLHHDPGAGAREDRERFRATYVQTLMRYEREFGEAAPVRFWPMPQDRTARILKLDTVFRTAVRLRRQLAGTVALVIGLALLSLAGDGEGASSALAKVDGDVVVGIIFVVIVVGVVIARLGGGKGGGKGGSHGGCGSSCGSDCGGGCGGD
ncbi:hypothetical protein QEH57_03060 [Pelagicoccus sp. SDUM812005]|nr:hypothetical protein [Pelagicoccus sp. SDUM812005]